MHAQDRRVGLVLGDARHEVEERARIERGESVYERVFALAWIGHREHAKRLNTTQVEGRQHGLREEVVAARGCQEGHVADRELDVAAHEGLEEMADRDRAGRVADEVDHWSGVQRAQAVDEVGAAGELVVGRAHVVGPHRLAEFFIPCQPHAPRSARNVARRISSTTVG